MGQKVPGPPLGGTAIPPPPLKFQKSSTLGKHNTSKFSSIPRMPPTPLISGGS